MTGIRGGGGTNVLPAGLVAGFGLLTGANPLLRQGSTWQVCLPVPGHALPLDLQQHDDACIPQISAGWF